MNIFNIPHFYYLLASQFCFIFTYFVGFFGVKLFKNNLSENFNFVQKLLVGFIIISVIFALYTTKFNSSFILLVFLFCFIFIRHKTSLIKNLSIIDFKIEYKLFGYFFILNIIIFYFIYFIQFYYSDSAVVSDNYFYSRIIRNLIDNKVETLNFWLFPQQATNYHYHQFWFTAFFSKIFNLNTLHGYYFIFSVFLLTWFVSVL